MKLRDMLTEVGILVPSDIPLEVQVSWMNQVQSSLYRYYGIGETPHNLIVQPSVSFYDLPPNCIPERVRRLVVGDEELEYVASDEDNDVTATTKFWTVFNKQVFISPVPVMMENATLYYLASPTPLDIGAIDDEATFPADYIELLILGCAIKVAIAAKAADILPSLQIQFQTLRDRAEQIMGNKRQQRVNVVYPWG